ncbi:hypothetical protein RA280_14035 [Cupriavidus sp. CV2]|uniref:hypothetical protein n=1 Tax=Cupriavidus ulmosensis TaxID=3065913 RepID=UPI00296A9E5E|nr:hypothetical protein [Cupriavidus sp. CV2]MDW3682845.1 hypothetical protein [Cupriavidus sp. CV2]
MQIPNANVLNGYSIGIDRTNILGHAEPDPHTGHRDVLVVRQLAKLSGKAWMR